MNLPLSRTAAGHRDPAPAPKAFQPNDIPLCENCLAEMRREDQGFSHEFGFQEQEVWVCPSGCSDFDPSDLLQHINQEME